MDRQRFFEILGHGLTLCIDEIAKELTAGLVAESGATQRHQMCRRTTRYPGEALASSAGSSITIDQAFWYNLDDALYALEDIPARFAGADELKQVRETIIHWQNELATAHTAGCARTAA